MLAKLTHTFATIMTKTCYINSVQQRISCISTLIITDMISLLNHQIFLVIDVELVQQAIALLNHSINFFP